MDISLFKNRLDWILCAEKITNVGLLGADSKTNVKGISELLSDCFACLGTQVKDWPNTQICKTDKYYSSWSLLLIDIGHKWDWITRLWFKHLLIGLILSGRRQASIPGQLFGQNGQNGQNGQGYLRIRCSIIWIGSSTSVFARQVDKVKTRQRYNDNYN